MILERFSYGAKYNHIYIDNINNIVKKVCFNREGYKKIYCEIQWLKYISNITDFPIPKILISGNDYYEMEYLKKYKPLYLSYPCLTEADKVDVLNKIYSTLTVLHNFEIKPIDYDNYVYNLKLETEIKPIERFDKIEHIIKKYDFIKTVNGVSILPFKVLVDRINKKIDEHLLNKKTFSLTLIHGDCQFNNILYNETDKNIFFIDPRGYFGNYELYGIPEYDYAKIKFALSGYDKFDNNRIVDLKIYNDNIDIEIEMLSNNIFTDSLDTLLMLTIWLSNSHSFIDNENKLIYSYFIGIYFCCKFLNS